MKRSSSMQTTNPTGNSTQFVHRGTQGALDVFGPTVEFLTLPEEPDTDYCVMIGTIPPGVSVPLHSHPDPESFYVLSGSVRTLDQRGDTLEWRTLNPGDFAHIPGHAKHALAERVERALPTTNHDHPEAGEIFPRDRKACERRCARKATDG